MRPLKWGIIGTGKICHDFAVSLNSLSFVSPNENEICSVASRSLEKAKNFANEHKIDNYYGSYKELLSETSVDVVYIGTINTTHFDLIKEALKNGKNILCEKPMCMNLQETQDVVSYAKNKGLFLMEGLWSRFLPSYDKIRETLENGAIGEILEVYASFGTMCNHVERINKKNLGGGAILDRGIYCIQLATLCYKNQIPYKVHSLNQFNEDGVDMSSRAILEYENGAIATLVCSSEDNYENNAYIVGTKGTIKLEAPFWKCLKFQIDSEEHSYKMPITLNKTNFWNNSGMIYEIQAVRNSILAGKSECNLMTLDDSVLIAQISEMILSKN